MVFPSTACCEITIIGQWTVDFSDRFHVMKSWLEIVCQDCPCRSLPPTRVGTKEERGEYWKHLKNITYVRGLKESDNDTHHPGKKFYPISCGGALITPHKYTIAMNALDIRTGGSSWSWKKKVIHCNGPPKSVTPKYHRSLHISIPAMCSY